MTVELSLCFTCAEWGKTYICTTKTPVSHLDSEYEWDYFLSGIVSQSSIITVDEKVTLMGKNVTISNMQKFFKMSRTFYISI